MRVLVTGASGYIGGAVARCLRTRGYSVVGLARSDDSARRLESMGLVAHRGDLSEPGSLAPAAKEADAVVHTAMSWGAQAGAMDARAVETLVEAMAGSGKPLIYTSGIWVMGDTGGRVVTEDDPVNPPALVSWRLAVERWVLNATVQFIRASVIRPAMVYGHRGGIPCGFAKTAREEGAARVIGNGENHWGFVHLNDLAELYVRMVEHAPGGTVLLASAGDALKVKDVAAAASRGAGAEGRVNFVPLEEARRTMGGLADALAMDQAFDSSRARKLLGWNPTCPSVIEELEQGAC